ncbi:hypothetical protein Salat_0276000 [Sesamum alatum]|uniref:Uncharacterized protein n=1 Tax=Sesamum alatum TaxID=300844 RepID=A0AAE1Z122_9LAMI|nr:hypothetical protein Salat_0276000 [Sesamum alatum]
MGQRLCCLRPPSTHTPPKNVSQTTSSVTTLEDCLMSSPALGSGEIQVFKPTGKRVYPSSPDMDSSSMFYTPRMSFSSSSSSGKLEKIDELCMRKQLKKKVRFKEADIMIFYSPSETFDDDDQ